jgi:hypothetical protein
MHDSAPSQIPQIRSRLLLACLALVLAASAPALAGDDFERAPVERASDLLPPELLKGPYHHVDEEVTTDGFLRIYTVRSEVGVFEARGEDGVRTRVRQIEALSRLAELSRSTNAGFAGKGGVPDFEPTSPPEAASDESSNPRLHRILDEYSDEDKERLNRIELAVMGVPEALREKFIANPAYTSQHRTILVESLAAMEGTRDRATFIAAAMGADEETEAQAFQRMAELMRSYGDREGGLDRIVEVDGQLAARGADGSLVVPVLADHALWTRQVAHFAEAIAEATGDDAEASKARLIFSGTLSERARNEIEDLGIGVRDDLFGAPPPRDAASDEARGAAGGAE